MHADDPAPLAAVVHRDAAQAQAQRSAADAFVSLLDAAQERREPGGGGGGGDPLEGGDDAMPPRPEPSPPLQASFHLRFPPGVDRASALRQDAAAFAAFMASSALDGAPFAVTLTSSGFQPRWDLFLNFLAAAAAAAMPLAVVCVDEATRARCAAAGGSCFLPAALMGGVDLETDSGRTDEYISSLWLRVLASAKPLALWLASRIEQPFAFIETDFPVLRNVLPLLLQAPARPARPPAAAAAAAGGR